MQTDRQSILQRARNLPTKQKFDLLFKLARGFLLYPKFSQKRYVLAGRGVRVTRQSGSIILGWIVGLGTQVGIAVIGEDSGHPATLRIGNHTHIQDRTHINCHNSIMIGDHCAISWDVEILDTDIHSIIGESGQALPRTAPVAIEDRVWIGTRSIILKGATIGHDSVVAAGAIVTQSIPPFSICAGSPARVIKKIHGWES